MATQRMTHTAGRSSSSCLRKYRILFAFGLTVLCVQVYLAHMFLGLEIRNGKSGRLASGEGGWSQPEEDEGQARGLRQLKLPPDKRVNKSAQPQRNRTARIKLDRKLLSFAPACDVTGREAVSAVTRAQSQACKERIVNVTCLNQQGLLYPERIQSLCPNSPGFRDAPVSLGCYKDDKTLRILSSYYHVFKGNNSPERCAFMCLQSGYPYAGTEYSVECFCGVEQPSPLKRLPDSSCNMKCSGNPKQSCGGYLTINIFSTGIKKFTSHEARNLSLENDPRKPARIAYLLTVNGRGSRQVKRLISILYHPSHLFYIHVDARQDYLYREMLEVESSCESKNIRVARGDGLRHASIWGGASLLTTLLKSAQQMLALNHDWDFLVNLSESDFPVKTDARLAEFLGWNRGMNFVKSHGREVQRFIAKQGLDKTFVECEARMWRIGDRKLPNGIQIDGGSDWVALSRDFVEYVATENPDTLVAELLKVFRYTLLPAESFFHTVLRNSRFCDTYVDNNLHVTNWKRKLGCKCQYKAVVDWCGCSPNDFKVEDLPRLRNTADRNLFFARKFEPSIDQRIIDRLEEWLYPENANKTVLLTGYDSYWQSIYHRADLSPIPDDALLTVSQSLARIAFRKSTETSVEVRLIETTGFFRANRFVGVLVHAEDSAKERLEALVHQRRNVSVRGDWLGKVRRLEVSTDYDQKEQTFRNLVGSMGPHSSPALLYEFDGVVALQNVTVLWVDPRGTLADVNRLQLDETSLVGHVKPQLTDRLAVGTWRLYLATDTGAFLAKTSFLVVPLEYRRGERISEQTSVEVNNNNNNNVSTHGYHVSVEERKKWSSLIGPGDQVSPERDSPELDLRKRIDRLVYEHYDVVAVCQSRSVPSSEQRKLVKCGDTDWSSMSPDTKSDMRKICKQ